MSMTQLDADQAIKTAFDDNTGTLKVSGTVSTTVGNFDVISTYKIAAASINGSGGALFQVDASLPGNAKQVFAYDTTGSGISIFTGASGFEVEKQKFGPGTDVITPCIIASGTRITIRANDTSAPSAGNFFLTFYG